MRGGLEEGEHRVNYGEIQVAAPLLVTPSGTYHQGKESRYFDSVERVFTHSASSTEPLCHFLKL